MKKLIFKKSLGLKNFRFGISKNILNVYGKVKFLDKNNNNKIYLRTKYLSERLSMEKKEVNSLSYSVTNKLQKLKIS